MKNKVIISAIIAFFAVAGIAILSNGMNAHALSPEEGRAHTSGNY